MVFPPPAVESPTPALRTCRKRTRWDVGTHIDDDAEVFAAGRGPQSPPPPREVKTPPGRPNRDRPSTTIVATTGQDGVTMPEKTVPSCDRRTAPVAIGGVGPNLQCRSPDHVPRVAAIRNLSPAVSRRPTAHEQDHHRPQRHTESPPTCSAGPTDPESQIAWSREMASAAANCHAGPCSSCPQPVESVALGATAFRSLWNFGQVPIEGTGCYLLPRPCTRSPTVKITLKPHAPGPGAPIVSGPSVPHKLPARPLPPLRPRSRAPPRAPPGAPPPPLPSTVFFFSRPGRHHDSRNLRMASATPPYKPTSAIAVVVLMTVATNTSKGRTMSHI